MCRQFLFVSWRKYMKLIKLSKSFYSRHSSCTELLHKENRPYTCFSIKIDDVEYAIPLRHRITHKHCFHTTGMAGLDFTKSVVITSPTDIDVNDVWIDSVERNIINANEEKIRTEYIKYLNQYKRALNNPTNPRSQRLLSYSTLQYFIK